MSRFKYNYFYYINDEKFIIEIDKDFSDISDLEDVSRFGHQMRRKFAEHIVFKFGVSSPCILDHSDFDINPFGKRLAEIFNNHATCSFLSAGRTTTLVLSGS